MEQSHLQMNGDDEERLKSTNQQSNHTDSGEVSHSTAEWKMAEKLCKINKTTIKNLENKLEIIKKKLLEASNSGHYCYF